jgi:integrase
MTSIRVRGVNRVTAKGRVYHYHRATGTRLQHDPVAEPEAFVREVNALNQGAPPPTRDAVAGTLGALIGAYKASPEWRAHKPATRAGYERAFDAVKELDELDLDQIDQAFLLGLRDTIFERSGRWLANYAAVTVPSVVFKWGMPRGHCSSNPAAGVPKIKRAKGKPKQNKAWLADEVEAMLKALAAAGYVGVRKAVALAYYAGLRKQDVVAVANSARAKQQVELDAQSKTDRPITIFEVNRLKRILDEPDKADGSTLVRRDDGQPYTADGLDTLFHRVKTKLAGAGKIRKGLTFHGLRTSLGKRAAEAGHSEHEIAAALGHANPASSRPYTVEANRKRNAARVFKSLKRKR